jgi:hypothetical protein
MERAQCIWENLVDYNLSESGVSPLRVQDLLGDELDADDLLNTKLSYSWAGGSPELRERIAEFYGAGPENVRVTNGSSEANFMEFWGLIDKGDRVAVMLPNYLQTWGLARHFAGKGGADAFYMVQRTDKKTGTTRWALDIEGLKKAVTKRTKVILITNPNNPTGSVLTEEEMNAVVKVARKAGAWIVSDEVYRGAELKGDEITPSFYGRYSKVIITGGLSKAFGLPGLRIGWIVGPPKTVERLEGYHDYLTLTLTTLSDRLARIAMEPAQRERLFQRTRTIVRKQLPELERWIDSHKDILCYTPPDAGAIAIIKYDLPIKALKMFERLIHEKSVLITPAEHFGLKGKYFRVGYGYDMDVTLKGLALIGDFFDEVRT